MNKLISSILFLLVVSTLFLSSCDSQGKTFQIKGEIISAEDQVLYLEHRSLAGIQMIDSVKLKKNGKFTFKESAPENPEFYQLRLGEQVIILAVDSVETFNIEADGSNLYGTYKIEPAILNEQIKNVINMQRTAKSDISTIVAQHENKEIDDVAFMENVDSVLSVYKSYATKVILGNPSSAAAYYAVFQKIDDYLIFDPYDKKDYSMFGAVATSWGMYYPETARTKHLYEFTMNALRVRKQEDKQSDFMNNITVTDTQLPDISLMNVKGQKVSLSSFRGKYVLLDFTAYKSEFSLKHNEILNKVYNKYKSEGFEIFQISFDSDTHFWKNVAVELPWTTVHDPQSINSMLLKNYNVRELPTAYVLNKEGDLMNRIEDFNDLDSYIIQLP